MSYKGWHDSRFHHYYPTEGFCRQCGAPLMREEVSDNTVTYGVATEIWIECSDKPYNSGHTAKRL